MTSLCYCNAFQLLRGELKHEISLVSVLSCQPCVVFFQTLHSDMEDQRLCHEQPVASSVHSCFSSITTTKELIHFVFLQLLCWTQAALPCRVKASRRQDSRPTINDSKCARQPIPQQGRTCSQNLQHGS